MNPLTIEYLAEEHRRDLVRELNDIRLQEEALKSIASHPKLFSLTMHKFGHWLISRGEVLIRRYDVHANSATTSEHRFAH